MWTRQGGWSKDRFQPQEAEVWDVGGIGQYPEQWRLTLGTPVARASFGPQLLLLFWCARNRACCHCFCCQSAVPTSYTEGLWLFLRLEYSSESFFSGDGVHDVFYPKIGCTVSLLHTNVQVVNFQRCKRVCHQCQMWGKLQLAVGLLSLTVLQLCRLPPPLPPPGRNSSCLFTRRQPAPVYQLLYCTTVLSKIKNVFLLFIYFLCENVINLLQFSTT